MIYKDKIILIFHIYNRLKKDSTLRHQKIIVLLLIYINLSSKTKNHSKKMLDKIESILNFYPIM